MELKKARVILTEIRELQQKIVEVCIKCPHAAVYCGLFQCKQSRRACHSAKVKRWLAEIERLEKGGPK